MNFGLQIADCGVGNMSVLIAPLWQSCYLHQIFWI